MTIAPLNLLAGRVCSAGLCAVFVSALLAGCATPRLLRSIPTGESVSIAVASSSNYPADVDFRNTAVGDGVSVGAGSGAVIGGLWGLGCGPLIVLCVPLGAATGMVAGAAAGAAVGTTGALAQDKADRVKARLLRVEQAHPLLVELKQNLDDRAQKLWKLDPQAAKVKVIVELQSLKFETTRDERVRLVMQFLVSVQDPAPNPDGRATLKKYDYASPFGGLAAWLDEQGDFPETSLASASRQVAAQVIADLSAR